MVNIYKIMYRNKLINKGLVQRIIFLMNEQFQSKVHHQVDKVNEILTEYEKIVETIH